MSDPFDDFMEDLRDIRKGHNQIEQEFRKLAIEPCGKVPLVGDRVIVATGLLGMGFLWVRKEAVVIETADTSYHLRFKDEVDYKTKMPLEIWVHQALITDVLERKPNESLSKSDLD